MTTGWRCQALEHDADHGEADEGDDGSGMALEVAGEAPVAADPGEGFLHDPGPDGGAASCGMRARHRPWKPRLQAGFSFGKKITYHVRNILTPEK